jgi:hypothetical protein
MAKLIPGLDTFRPMTAGDHTERDILRQLQDGLPEDYTVFHHLHWANARPQGDQHGELDMVVMNRAGDLAALEVKAGELDLGPHGMFKRYGAAFKDVGYQVQRQFNKLQERLRQRNWDIRLQHFLVLPHQQVDDDEASIGFPRERIIDARDCQDLPACISRHLSLGLDDESMREQVGCFMLDQLGLQLDVTALSGRLAAQVRVLSGGLATWVPRITSPTGVVRVQATAGSGKTQLALGLLTQATQRQQRAAYVCFNRPLADHLRQIAPKDETGAQVSTFHQLCWEHAGRPSETELNFADMTAGYLAAAPMQLADLDLLIIDEMQDMQVEWVQALLHRLKDAGRLYVMDDPDQCLYPDREPIDLPEAVVVTSRENHRSPRKLVELVNLLKLTEEPVEACSPFEGELPGFHTYQPGDRSLVKATVAAVERCLGMGFSLDDIVVLTWRGRERSELHNETLGPWGLRRFSGRYDEQGRPCWSDGALTIDTLRRFKGQAAKAVVLSEVDFDLMDDLTNALLFTGMSRSLLHAELVLTSAVEKYIAARISHAIDQISE